MMISNEPLMSNNQRESLDYVRTPSTQQIFSIFAKGKIVLLMEVGSALKVKIVMRNKRLLFKC